MMREHVSKLNTVMLMELIKRIGQKGEQNNFQEGNAHFKLIRLKHHFLKTCPKGEKILCKMDYAAL